MSMKETFKLLVLQMAATPEPKANLERIRRLLTPFAGRGDLILLPENSLCLGNHLTVAEVARPEEAWIEFLAPLACELRTPLAFGGLPVRTAEGIFNRLLLLGRSGEFLARYDKMHLFQLDPGQPGGVDETTTYTHGRTPVSFELNGWKLGLSICYDLRFPELYRAYAPADLLLCPAAFARETGTAHWMILFRARAIENQAYFAGAGLCGRNAETTFRCFGHSLVVDPWGEILAQAGGAEEDEQVIAVELTKARLAEVRSRLPALTHRRLLIVSK